MELFSIRIQRTFQLVSTLFMRMWRKIFRKENEELLWNIWLFGMDSVFLHRKYRQIHNNGEYGNKNTANIGIEP